MENSNQAKLPQNQSPHMQPQQYMSDEVDLVELVAMAWRLRYATVGGAALGLLGGVAFTSLRSPTYETTLPITISRDSFPANSDAKRALEMYTSALNAPDGANAAFNSLISSSPELAQNLKAKGISVNDLIRTQTAIENVGKPNKAPLQITANASDFFVTTRLPVRGVGEQAQINLVNAINAAGVNYNQQKIQNHDPQLNGEPNGAAQSGVTTVSKQHSVLLSALASQTRIKGELAELEYKLLRTTGSEGANFARLAQSAPIILSIANSSETKAPDPATQPIIVAADFERVIRLKSILVHEKRMTAVESGEFDNRIARLQIDSQLIRTELVPLLLDLKTANNADLAPSFTVDSIITPEKAKLVRVESTSSKALPVLGTGFLGAMLGFFGMAALRFILRNKKRISDLLSKEE